MVDLTAEQHLVVNRYTGLVKKHGFSYQSLDWGSRASQQARFQVLCDVGALKGKSILDVGCGLCDFYQYLCDQNVEVDYHGTDITSEMIIESKKKYPALNLEVRDIVKSPIERKYDYVFSSGVFAYMPEKKYAFELIEAMHHQAKLATSFNSLSSWASDKTDGELSLDPSETLQFCKKISSKLVLRHDYMPHDFSLYVYN